MKLDLIVLKTIDTKVLSTFYSKLGIDFEYHSHGNGPYHFAGKIGETVFEIYPLPKNVEKADDTLRLGFSISALDEKINELRSLGAGIQKEAELTEWGYQAIVVDPDGRKVELKEEGINCAAFEIHEAFKITNKGLVLSGIIKSGIISTGDEIHLVVNGEKRIRKIKGIDSGLRKFPLQEPVISGLLIECIDEKEIDELRQYEYAGQIAVVNNLISS